MRMIIKISSLGSEDIIAFDEEKKACVVNGERKDINVEVCMQEILNVLCSAEEVMVDESITDGITYTFTIEKNGKIREYYFKNAFPKGFEDIVNIIGGLKRC